MLVENLPSLLQRSLNVDIVRRELIQLLLVVAELAHGTVEWSVLVVVDGGVCIELAVGLLVALQASLLLCG